MRPSSESTPDDLLKIDEDNGGITVNEGATIDCDGDPKIFDLVYTITINDGELESEGEVKFEKLFVSFHFLSSSVDAFRFE